VIGGTAPAGPATVVVAAALAAGPGGEGADEVAVLGRILAVTVPLAVDDAARPGLGHACFVVRAAGGIAEPTPSRAAEVHRVAELTVRAVEVGKAVGAAGVGVTGDRTLERHAVAEVLPDESADADAGAAGDVRDAEVRCCIADLTAAGRVRGAGVVRRATARFAGPRRAAVEACRASVVVLTGLRRDAEIRCRLAAAATERAVGAALAAFAPLPCAASGGTGIAPFVGRTSTGATARALVDPATAHPDVGRGRLAAAALVDDLPPRAARTARGFAAPAGVDGLTPGAAATTAAVTATGGEPTRERHTDAASKTARAHVHRETPCRNGRRPRARTTRAPRRRSIQARLKTSSPVGKPRPPTGVAPR
jgi:hypothetical protein